MNQRALALLPLSAVALTVALSASASPPPQGIKSSVAASAYALRVLVPGDARRGTHEVTAPPDTVSLGGSFSFPADGSVVATGSETASASSSGGALLRSAASAEVDSLSLFGGEVTADRVVADARASASASDAA